MLIQIHIPHLGIVATVRISHLNRGSSPSCQTGNDIEDGKGVKPDQTFSVTPKDITCHNSSNARCSDANRPLGPGVAKARFTLASVKSASGVAS